MKKDVLQPKNFLMLTIAGMINAFGVTCFLYPVNLYDSGISGTACADYTGLFDLIYFSFDFKLPIILLRL